MAQGTCPELYEPPGREGSLGASMKKLMSKSGYEHCPVSSPEKSPRPLPGLMTLRRAHGTELCTQSCSQLGLCHSRGTEGKAAEGPTAQDGYQPPASQRPLLGQAQRTCLTLPAVSSDHTCDMLSIKKTPERHLVLVLSWGWSCRQPLGGT